MKKCKIIIMAVLAVFAVAALAGCGNADNEETGSNPDSDNGVVEQIVTDAATGAKEVITDAATGAKEIITDAAKGIDPSVINDNSIIILVSVVCCSFSVKRFLKKNVASAIASGGTIPPIITAAIIS